MAFAQDLLKPPEAIAYQKAATFTQSVSAGRNICLVGKKDAVCREAKELASAVGQPLVYKKAESMQPGYKGVQAELPWLFGDELRKVMLVVLPEAAGRCVTSTRPEVIAKQLHGKVAGVDVFLAVGGEEDVLAAGLAVARCLSPYSAKTEKAKEASICNVGVCGSSELSEETLKQLTLGAESVRIAQGLVDMPPNVVYPTSLKDFVLEATAGVAGVSHTVIEGEELRSKGYGLLYAVGKCAPSPPCLIVLTHEGSAKGQQSKGVALVGKGITFDTGGAALKSRDGMIGMKRDMGGAAGTFGAFLALARGGGLPSGQKLHCVLCVAENSIGSKAFVQDDIITGYSGLTVEINNTDAEGRLVLADGVSHVAKHLDCGLVVDMATLTGAQGISTGSHHGMILATDEDLEHDIIASGKLSGDMVHPGIFAPELLMHEFDSEFADMRNSVKNRSNAQSSCAGLFIHRHLVHSGYAGRWLHVDMAYPVHDPLGEYATGWGVGLLATYLSKPRSFDISPTSSL
eukprot:TRINITY_DN10072_c0_g1_i1.p1 TRINITY_DN10072_c0_g1~~TRINITY_DN10072_c0_g1_i1.p1  ORF type:complete len:589 (-),score=121.86 TRINITY_DN10072_c0_g1_i1:84-1631(-)